MDCDALEAMVDREFAASVRCCDAGQVAYPIPCPWHGEADPMYAMTRERMPLRHAESPRTPA
jgi:hypothetical protein